MSYREELTEREKPIWDEACALFEEMLSDFNSKNLLRKGIIRMDRERLKLIWENSRNYGMAFNEIQKKFESEETFKKFASNASLTPQTLTYLFISQMIGTLLVYFESVFKTSLLFFLEEEEGITKKMTLGQLLRQIKEISPSIGTRLERMIDTKLRNALAHGTFWFMEGGRVFLATNSYLEEVEEITLMEFWIEVRKMSIIGIAFINTLHRKIEEGYFKL